MVYLYIYIMYMVLYKSKPYKIESPNVPLRDPYPKP